jgi:putative ABC transport system permease protein
MESLFQDLRYALRMCRESLGFTAVALLVLAVGIGVNTAVFSILDRVLLEPIRVPDPERLVFIMNKANDGTPIVPASPLNFLHWRAETGVFEDVAAARNLSLDYLAGDRPESVVVGTVSADYFRLLRAPLAAGRGFLADDDLPGAPGTAVISHRFWMDRLGGAGDAVGRTISLSGRAYTIVGIAAREFDVGDLLIPIGGAGDTTVDDAQLWVPLALDPNTTDEGPALQVLARLKGGVTLAQAQERLVLSLAEYRERYPDSFEAKSANPNHGFTALPVQQVVALDARPTLLLLMGAVALVLLIACANVAGLLLVRALRREHEIAIRAALGAGRARIVRQLLVESTLLSVAGGALGLVVGVAGIRVLLSIDTGGLPRLDDGALAGLLDWRVALFTLGVSLATGVAFGLVPALVSARTDLNRVINRASRAGGVRGTRLRRGLVAAEVGLAVVLVIGAGLLIRTMLALGAVDLAFSAERLVAMRTSLSDARFESTASVAALVETVLERVRSLPGVEAAAASCCVPLQNSANLPFDIVGREAEAPFTGVAVFAPVSAGYFETLGIRVLAGRPFDERDAAGAAPVAIIDQVMAERYFAAGLNPLEVRVVVGGGAEVIPQAAAEPPRQIVGIVGSVWSEGTFRDPQPTLYIPLSQTSDALNAAIVESTPSAWLVRTRSPSAATAATIREEISRATGEPTTGVTAMGQLLAATAAPYRLKAWLMSVFGGVALLLTAVAIYGVISYAVEQRRREIGIRMALGAEASDVRAMVVRDGMLPVVAGVGAGLAAAYALSNLLAATLFGVKAHDLAVFATVPLALTAVGFAAAAVPAFRASRVAPTVALRQE